MKPTACRLCGDILQRSFVDLGLVPLANYTITAEAAALGQDRCFPLHARVCDSCLLVQIDIVEDRNTDSVGPVAHRPAHAANYTSAMIDRLGLGSGSLVMEVASTDGTRLRLFRDRGIPVLGIEPMEALAARARNAGIPTESALLNAETAMDIAAKYGRADLVTAHDVLPLVSDMFGFLAGFAGILRPHGVATFEFPHLLWLTENVRFDAIDHAHHSYLSLLVVERILHSVGLRVFDLERLPEPSGALRIFVGHGRGPYGQRPSVRSMRAQETAAGLDRAVRYDAFAPKVADAIQALRTFVASRRRAGRRLAAYGPVAESNTLFSCCGLTSDDIVCVADNDLAKQGRLLPGSRIPIVSAHTMIAVAPDDVLIFPCEQAADVAAELWPRLRTGTSFWGLGPRLLPLMPELEVA